MNVSLHSEAMAGLRLEYFRQGSGRKLLFLHAGDGIDACGPVLAALARTHEVLAPSLPGFGASEMPEHFSNVDDLAYYGLDLLASLGWREVLLVGVSFGAWVAAEMAIKATERLAGLVLADAVGVKFAGPEQREIADLLTIAVPDLPRLVFRDPAPHSPDLATLPDEALFRIARAREALAQYGWAPTLHDPKLRQRLHRIDRPCLVLWGADDRVVAPDYGQRLAACLPQAEFALLPAAGHHAHIEAPEAFAARIARFAAGLNGES